MKRTDEGRRWRLGRLVGIAVMLAIGALVLAACGGGSSGGSESSSTTNTGTEGSSGESSDPKGGPGRFEISAEQRSCLKEKGVELPDFKGGAGAPPQGGGPPEGFQSPAGGQPPQGAGAPAGGPPGGAGGKKFEEQRKSFEECGVELGGFKGGPGGKPDVSSAAFKKQVKEYVACVRENGYQLAEPNFSGEGPIFKKSESESDAFKRASKKCQSRLGGTASGGGGEP